MVRALLSHGDKCTAVGWTQENTIEQMEKWQPDKNCLGMLCDVRVKETVDRVIRKSIEHWGRVDIIAKYVLPHPFHPFLLNPGPFALVTVCFLPLPYQQIV